MHYSAFVTQYRLNVVIGPLIVFSGISPFYLERVITGDSLTTSHVRRVVAPIVRYNAVDSPDNSGNIY